MSYPLPQARGKGLGPHQSPWLRFYKGQALRTPGREVREEKSQTPEAWGRHHSFQLSCSPLCKPGYLPISQQHHTQQDSSVKLLLFPQDWVKTNGTLWKSHF